MNLVLISCKLLHLTCRYFSVSSFYDFHISWKKGLNGHNTFRPIWDKGVRRAISWTVNTKYLLTISKFLLDLF
jgi:hypothetical protein